MLQSRQEPIIYYAHDPMCSWCYAYAPILKKLLSKIPDRICVEYVVGGLAPDTNVLPMSPQLQTKIQNIWRHIEQVTATRFNFEFWDKNTPVRNTYPACRAIIAAKLQDSSREVTMITAIQRAYYRNALNPSVYEVLEMCAQDIGLDAEKFREQFHAEATETEFRRQLAWTRFMGVAGFPALSFKKPEEPRFYSLPIVYDDEEITLRAIRSLI